MSTKQSNSLRIITIIAMMFLYAMIAFVTNLAAPVGKIWEQSFEGNHAQVMGMLGNMMNFLAYLIMGIPAGLMLSKIGYKKTALIAVAVGLLGVLVQWLSGETASGNYPVEAVETMSRIAIETEESILTPPDLDLENVTKPIAGVLARSLVAATLKLPVKAIIFDTWSGRTGRYLAEFRPKVPIYGMCYRGFTMRELALTYDIYGYPFEITETKEEFVANATKILLEDGKVQPGDLVGFIGGSFSHEAGATYMEFRYI